MKKIEAIIRSSKLEQVKKRLAAVDVASVSTTRIRSCETQVSAKAFGGVTTAVDRTLNVKLETVVDDWIVDDWIVDATVDAISANAHTGEPGDGAVLVLPLEAVVEIQTGEITLGCFMPP